MTRNRLNTMDVIYDDKEYGNIIDANQWNDNFKEIENKYNQGQDEVAAILDDLVSNLDDLASNVDGSSGADQIGSTALNVGGAETVQGQLEENYANIEAHKILATAHGVNLLAPLASPALTGVPTAPTAADETSTTQIATTKFVMDNMALAGLADMRKSVYDPNGKSADAFDVDNHVSGSTNKVFSATEQTKLGTIDEGAEVNPTIVNGLTETVTGKVLDATQGKTLNDKISAIKRTPTTLKSVDFTFALVDEAQLIKCLSASDIVATIPKNTSVDFPVNVEIPILRYGAGTVTITPDTDVTLNGGTVGIPIDAQYDTVMIKQMADDEWLFVGVK